MRTKWTKWAPAGVAVVVVAGAAIAVPLSANASASLPTKTAAQVIELVASSHVTAFSGTVTETSDLGLPSLPSGASAAGGGSDSGLSSILSLITGTNSLRVYADGATKQRLQVLDSLSEKDVIHNGKNVWLYDSSSNSVTHTTLPAQRHTSSPKQLDVTPDVLAKKLLAELRTTSTVTVGQDINLAGRSAYDLVLTPKVSDTLVGSITIAVDSSTGMPLGVDVQAAGQKNPAVSVEFTSLTLAAPDASLFDFTPPAGAKVTQEKAPAHQKADAHTKSPAHEKAIGPKAKVSTKPKATVTGKGWDAVIDVSKVASLSKLSTSPEFAELTTAVSGGRVLHTTLFNVLFTDDGRVIAGAVSVSRLQAVAVAS